jgi:hypothetical protein
VRFFTFDAEAALAVESVRFLIERVSAFLIEVSGATALFTVVNDSVTAGFSDRKKMFVFINTSF